VKDRLVGHGDPAAVLRNKKREPPSGIKREPAGATRLALVRLFADDTAAGVFNVTGIRL
jgi:hypothetical protein